MKKLTILFIATTLVALATMTAIAGNNGPAEIKLSARMGDVAFNHAEHRQLVPDCATCHHEGLEVGNCHSCHDAKTGPFKAKQVFHKLCKDCHKNDAGPTKCKECHVK
ncbi:MAG: cytochrome c3 family protein [Desulfuromonadales bacterium]|nr:cytochrome c3 family protein [Desulfuromonadales bacterium]